MSAPQSHVPENYVTKSSEDDIVRGNGSSQKQLADCLKRTLGSAAAISACQAHGWEGVIQYLMPRESRAA